MTLLAKRWILASVILIIAASTAVFVNAQASGYTISGYAWSDTIGWIDLNCSNSDSCGLGAWGFSANQSGAISGYAWSEHIGWISANDADLSGCPAAPCAATIVNDRLGGWLRALSADGDGWDGWISLSGTSPNYGPVLSGGNFSGYSWGSDVVGWVDWSLARASNSCTPNGTYACSSSTTIVDSCGNEISACTSGQVCSAGACGDVCTDNSGCPPNSYCPVTGVSACTVLVCPAGQHVENHRCVCDIDNLEPSDSSHPGGFCPVPCSVGLVCQGDDLFYQDASCDRSPVESCQFGCANSACLVPVASIDFAVTPTLVGRGEMVNVRWSSINTTSCSVSGNNGDSWSGISGTRTSGAINGQTIFRITCTDLSGEDVSRSITVNILSIFQDL